MRSLTCFETECSTCGRKLQIRTAYLGKRVTCPQCHSEFVALDPLMLPKAPLPQLNMLQRANELLSMHELIGAHSLGSAWPESRAREG